MNERITAIATDCSPVQIDPQLDVTVCTREARGDEDLHLAIRIRGTDGSVDFVDALNASSLDTPLDHVRVEGANARWLAIAYDAYECSRVLVIDRRRWQTALDTGCWHAGYYSVASLPSAEGCVLELASGEGDNNSVIRPPYRYDLCEKPVDLRKLE